MHRYNTHQKADLEGDFERIDALSVAVCQQNRVAAAGGDKRQSSETHASAQLADVLPDEACLGETRIASEVSVLGYASSAL